MFRRSSFGGVVGRSARGVQVCGLVAAVAAALLVSAPAAAQSWKVSHLAGPTRGGPGSADGTGTAAGFYAPGGVAVDVLGNAYVADTTNHIIRKVTPTGVVTTVAGLTGVAGSADGSATAARFNGPKGVAVDSAFNLYVADTGNHTIRAISAGGTVSTLAGAAGQFGTADGTGSVARFSAPSSLAVDGSGDLLVADTNNHSVRLVTPVGVVSTFAGLSGTSGSADGTGTAARFSNPRGVTVDGTGNLFVADQSNHTIRAVTPAAVVSTVAGLAGSSGTTNGTGSAARFYQPYGVAVSGTLLLVADHSNRTIRAITSSAVVSTFAGLAGSSGTVDGTGTSARFRGPAGIATNASGLAYVVDDLDSTCRAVTTGAVVTTLVGVGAVSGSTDGTGTAARFNAPNGVAVDGSGNVYVADTSNNVIRKITPAGAVTTLAGTPGASGSADGTGSTARFWAPRGLAADSAGTVYVADTYNDNIRVITPAGVVTTLAGQSGSSGSTDGTGTAARFYRPYAVAVDESSNLVYVADTRNGTVRRITMAGVVTTLAGLAGNGGSTDGTGSAARFLAIYGIAVDLSGNVYVTDTDNHTVRKITPAGVVTTLAGLAGVPGSSNGTGSTALFRFPRGIAVDASGTVFVSDTFNYAIRTINAAGVVRTPIGRAVYAGNVDSGGPRGRLNGTWGIAARAGQVYGADFESHSIRLFRRYQNADGDDDGLADPMVYRPATGTWFLLMSEHAYTQYGSLGWGLAGDVPAVGDFWREGGICPSVYRPTTGTWFVAHVGDAGIDDWKWFGWGEASDTLVQGDYDGDGMTDAAVYRASTGTWYIRPSSGTTPWNVVFGNSTDTPVPGDYDGDGATDIAVYRPSTGTWFVLKSSSGFSEWVFQGWGMIAHNDTPVPGDFDGDGKTDYAVYRPASGTWFVLNSTGGWSWWGWGEATDTPMPADYDGDAITDAAVYRPSTGTWYVRPSSGAAPWNVVFGASGDVPLRVYR